MKEAPWITLSADAIGDLELWRHYQPLVQKRLEEHQPYAFIYPRHAWGSEACVYERDFIESVLPVLPVKSINTKNGDLPCLIYTLCPIQMEILVYQAWMKADKEQTPLLYSFLTQLLKNLNIATIGG